MDWFVKMNKEREREREKGWDEHMVCGLKGKRTINTQYTLCILSIRFLWLLC